jgi:hypothetical protein
VTSTSNVRRFPVPNGVEIERMAESWEISLRASNKSPRTIEGYLALVAKFVDYQRAHDRPTVAINDDKGFADDLKSSYGREVHLTLRGD